MRAQAVERAIFRHMYSFSLYVCRLRLRQTFEFLLHGIDFWHFGHYWFTAIFPEVLQFIIVSAEQSRFGGGNVVQAGAATGAGTGQRLSPLR